jgi:hypothetical protein
LHDPLAGIRFTGSPPDHFAQVRSGDLQRARPLLGGREAGHNSSKMSKAPCSAVISAARKKPSNGDHAHVPATGSTMTAAIPRVTAKEFSHRPRSL